MPERRKLLIGCVADDFTGATDVASIFAASGMKASVFIGTPAYDTEVEADAIVIALKTRTTEPTEAVAESLAALQWLKDKDASKYYFKYCSTFDSTNRGNIGPVTDAMLELLGTDFTIACPAFPANARTVYKSNLFVGDVPLNESGMRDHPLTPMQDANLVRVLAPQTKHKVSSCFYWTVKAGPEAIRDWLSTALRDGVGIGVIDAIDDADLEVIAEAFSEYPLLTGASGLALGLARTLFADRVQVGATIPAPGPANGARAVISGSCSIATNGQVARMLESHEGYRIEVAKLANGEDVVSDALEWARDRLGRKPILFYATAAPHEVKANQSKFGAAQAGGLVEVALARLAKQLVENGVSELIVAGGETSGAVVRSLGVNQLDIGNEIAPGVPWVTASTSAGPISLALKSGNFGGRDFFLDAWDNIT